MNFLSKLKNHTITRNSISLALIQATNIFIPFAVYPYLTRILPINEFSTVALILASIQICFVVTDYGFSISGTYEIAKLQNKNDIGKYLSSVFIIKITLVSLALLALYIYLKKTIKIDHAEYFFSAALAVLSQAYQPTWFFQGIEKMKSITLSLVIARMFFILMVFITIDRAGDGSLVILYWGAAQFIGTCISIFMIYMEGYFFSKPDIQLTIYSFKNASNFFLSRIAVAAYTSANTILLGFFGSPAQVANYSICDQLYKGGQAITSPISQSMYPYMTKNKDWSLFFKILILIGGGIALFYFLFSFYTSDFINLVYGPEYSNASNILKIYLIVSVINYFGVSFGYTACSAINKINIANYSVIIGAFVHLLALYLIYTFSTISPTSIIIAVLLTETLVLLTRMLSVFYYKNKI